MKLKLKAKESSVPKLLIKTKPPKGGKGGNYKNFRTVELLNLSNMAQNEIQDFY